MRISDELLEKLAEQFIAGNIREIEGITFETYVRKYQLGLGGLA